MKRTRRGFLQTCAGLLAALPLFQSVAAELGLAERSATSIGTATAILRVDHAFRRGEGRSPPTQKRTHERSPRRAPRVPSSSDLPSPCAV